MLITTLGQVLSVGGPNYKWGAYIPIGAFLSKGEMFCVGLSVNQRLEKRAGR